MLLKRNTLRTIAGLPAAARRRLSRSLPSDPDGLMAAGVGLAVLGLASLPVAAVALGAPPLAVLGVVALFVFLTARRLMPFVRDFRDQYTLYRASYVHGADLLAHHDADGRLLCLSPGSQALVGHSGDTLIGRTLHGHIHPADWTALEALMSDLRRGDAHGLEHSVTADLRLRHRDGGYRWVEMRAATLPPGAAAEGARIVASYRCIEARKRREETLARARDSAEAASVAKTRFLANVSHELRTPLNAIIGFSEVMCVQMFGPLGARRYEEYADYIHESGRHLLDLINDILDMSKIEAGRYDLQLEPIRMPLVVERCLKTIAFAARKGGLKLAVDIPADLPDLEADGRAMRQILLNLLSNAIKFTGPGGSIGITLRSDTRWLELTVSDTGIGIPEDAVGRLGRPFEQVRQTVAFDGSAAIETEGGPRAGMPGTGLGLSIVKALVTLHGGVLEIESEEEVGTAVRVLLPLPAAPADPDTDDETRPATWNARSVASKQAA